MADIKSTIDYDWGKTTLPTLIDLIAQRYPTRPFAEIPLGSVVRDGYRQISIGQFANAINRAAWWMDEQFGKASASTTVKGYAGPQDVRYLILTLAGIKTGHVLFIPGLRNSLEANLSLIEAHKCSTFMMPAGPMRALFAEFLERSKVVCVDVPKLEFFLQDEKAPVYRWDVPFELAKHRPFVATQTSGTTGIPKAVTLRHTFMTAKDAMKRLPCIGLDPAALHYFTGKRILNSFPFFHPAGLGLALAGVFYHFTTIFLPPGPATSQVVVHSINEKKIEVAMLPPWTIQEITADPSLIHSLRKLEYIYTGAGPLPIEAGRAASAYTHIILGFGATENGHYPVEKLPREEGFQYIKFSPGFGFIMEEQTEGLYEMVMVRQQALEDLQSVFTAFPDLQEYRTKDLFSRHPAKSDLWKFERRMDDIVVLSTGEKFNPATIEQRLSEHPAVDAALVTGNGRFQTALLLQPAEAIEGERARLKYIDEIWPFVEDLNKGGVNVGRVLKDMIIVASPERRFIRAWKGNIQRNATIDMYQQEIEAAYALSENLLANEADSSHSQPVDIEETAHVEENVIRIVREATGWDRLEVDENLFDRGLDSLSAVGIARSIQRSAASHRWKRVSLKDIYDCANVHLLAQFLTTGRVLSRNSSDAMQLLYDKYTADLPIAVRPVAERADHRVVMLTGSSGSLGTYLLDALLADEECIEIICVNRRLEAKQTQLKSIKDKGLAQSLDRKPVTFLQIDFSKAYVGLDRATYGQLLLRVTHIIHNAWQVDFNQSLDHMAKTHIRAVRELVDFSTRSKFGASIFFVSSQGAVKTRPLADKGRRDTFNIPEEIIEDWTVAGDAGYTQSKLISERILATAATQSCVPVTVCRVGQIAGPVSGFGSWPKQEWLPSLLLSSQYLGALPSNLGSADIIDWVPVDLVARIMLELMVRSSSKPYWAGPDVYHVVNPQKAMWENILPHLKRRMKLPEVDYSKWMDKLTATAPDTEITSNPALKLLPFFESLRTGECVQLDTARSALASRTLRSLQPVGEAWVDEWLRQLRLNQE